MAMLALLALVTLPSVRAAANCNLIPSAVTALGSELGKVDRPIASPGQTVTVTLDFACRPSAPGFSPVLANNFVRIVFEPPGSAADPSLVTEVAVTPSSVSDCGPSRCAALSFAIPNTDALLAPPGDGRGLVGPASIFVEDANGNDRALINDLFQPTLSCDDRSPDPIFEKFVVLPPPKAIGQAAPGETVEVVMQAALDAGGDLIIPIDYTGVLPSGNAGPLARILDASWDLPAFESDPTTPISFPDNGFEWIRAFSDVGRSIPPFLEIEGAGGGVSGSVDAAVSVLHIQNDDGTQQIFDLTFRLIDGKGPVIINDPVSVTVGGAVPLESLTTAADTAVFVVDEGAQGQDLDGDGVLDSQVVQIKNVRTGNTIDTGAAVTKVSFDSINKQALANDGFVVAFLQSEAASALDVPVPINPAGDGDMLDDVLNVYDAGSGVLLSPPGLLADALPTVNGRSLAVTEGRYVVFGSFEGDDQPLTTELVSVDSSEVQPSTPSRDPSVSEDGQEIAFNNVGTGLLPQTSYVLSRGTTSGTTTIDFDFLTGTSTAQFDYDPGFQNFPVDYSNLNPGTATFVFNGDLATFGNTGTWTGTFTAGQSVDELRIDAAGTYDVCEPGTYPGLCPPFTPLVGTGIVPGSIVVLRATIPFQDVSTEDTPLPVGINEYEYEVVATVTNVVAPGGIPTSVDFTSTFETRAVIPPRSQVFLRDRKTGNTALLSRATQGAPGTGDSSRPSLDGGGMHAAFSSDSNMLVPGDTNGLEDVFLFDRMAGTTRRITAGAVAQANGASDEPAMSGDGGFVAFATRATNLFPYGAPVDGNGTTEDILIYSVQDDMIVDRVELPGGAQGNGLSRSPSLSWDGNVVTFESRATNFDPVSGGQVSVSDVFRFDRTTREMTRLSVAPDGTSANESSVAPSTSGDGRYTAFTSLASNLVEPDSNDTADVLVYDHATGELERVSQKTNGEQADDASFAGTISRNGERVAFTSIAANLIGDVTSPGDVVFLYDRVTNSLDVQSLDAFGDLLSGDPFRTTPALSGDGQTVAWHTVGDVTGSGGDANGSVDDVIARGVDVSQATDLDGNGRGGDRVLQVFDADFDAQSLRPNARVQFERASVAAGHVATLTKETSLASGVGGPPISLPAWVAGGVKDTDFDGAGDLVDPPTGLSSAANLGDGLRRFHTEWDLTGLDPAEISSAEVRLTTVQGSIDALDTEFFAVIDPVLLTADGILTPTDFESVDLGPVLGLGLPVPVLSVTGSPGDVDTFVFDVTLPVQILLQAGLPTLSIQGRLVGESPTLNGRGLQIRTTSTGVPPGPDAFPQLLINSPSLPGRNGDADLDDQVIFVYDTSADVLVPLGISARDLSLSDQVGCAVVAEADEGGGDLNGDEDSDDTFLAVVDLSSGTPVFPAVVTDIEADAVVASGPYCFFTTPESPGNDLNDDEDTNDRIIGAYDVPAAQELLIVESQDQDGNPLPAPERLAATEFVAAGSWVAFRSCEFDQGFRSMNRDGDASDCVMHLANVADATGPCEAQNTLRAAEKCDFDGCDPFFEPYRLRVIPGPGGTGPVVTLSFVTFEATQGGEFPGEGCLSTSPAPSCDFTTDGDDQDFVVQVFNPTTERVQAIEVSPETTVPPFPTMSFNKDLLVVSLPCEALALPGVDCNTMENVIAVVADSDGDGSLDTSLSGDDNCADFNPGQSDGDGDGLGSACDPDTDPVTGMETTTPEQELPGGDAKLCELTGDGVIDETDIDIIFGDRGQKAQPSDPRDPDRDRRITVLDARFCVNRCKNPDCEPDPLPSPGGSTSTGSGSSCGLLGLEALIVLLPWWIRRRRTR